MADLPLQHRKVVVTGGLGVLGRAVGEFLGARGAKVVLLDKATAPAMPVGAGPFTIGNVDNRADMPDADASKWVSPAALAAVIAFLLSDDASAITGALIPVAGRV